MCCCLEPEGVRCSCRRFRRSRSLLLKIPYLKIPFSMFCMAFLQAHQVVCQALLKLRQSGLLYVRREGRWFWRQDIEYSHLGRLRPAGERGWVTLSLIACTSDCLYQQEGRCTLERAASGGIPSAENPCVHFVPRQARSSQNDCQRLSDVPDAD